MVTCEVNSEWTIDVRTEPTPNPPRGGTLVFNITQVNGVNISGQVRELGGMGLSTTFTGTCRAVLQQHLNIMTFEFVWATVNVTLAGVTFPGDLNRFLGRFRATARTQRAEAAVGETAARVATLPPPALPPDSGDTGTSNGTQT